VCGTIEAKEVEEIKEAKEKSPAVRQGPFLFWELRFAERGFSPSPLRVNSAGPPTRIVDQA